MLVEGETGKVIRVAGAFDMSSNTELTLDFTLPDGSTVQKLTANGVVLGTGVTDPDLGVLAANEYVEYTTEAGFLGIAGAEVHNGTWEVVLTYTNTTPTPDQIYIGNCATFEVGKKDSCST